MARAQRFRLRVSLGWASPWVVAQLPSSASARLALRPRRQR